MKSDIWTKGLLATAGSALVGLMLASVAHAAFDNVVAEVRFAAPVTIGENNALQFGVLDVAFPNTETITVGTDDAVTGDTGNIVGGTQAAADLTITATPSIALSILVDNIISGSGYTLDTFLCSYQGGADTDCDGPGVYSPTSVASGTLEIGATITSDGTAALGPANGSFDVTVIYL